MPKMHWYMILALFAEPLRQVNRSSPSSPLRHFRPFHTNLRVNLENHERDFLTGGVVATYFG